MTRLPTFGDCCSLLCLLIVFAGITTHAQQAKPERPQAEIDAELKKNPELTKGFETSDGYKIRVIKTMPGGIVMEFSGKTAKGTATVKGPWVAEMPVVDTVNNVAKTLGSIVDLVNQLLADDDPTRPSGKKKKCVTNTTDMGDGTSVSVTICFMV